MLTPISQPLDLHSTLFSGQAFRWRRDGEWSSGVVFDNVVRMRQRPDAIEFTSTPDDEYILEPLLRDYLSLEADLNHIYDSIGRDEQVEESIARYRGMRILRQDPWECLVSFICAQASNIPRITRNVEDICAAFGQPLTMDDDIRFFTFPSPRQLAEVSVQSLRDLRLGYRARYIASAARAVADGKIDLMALREDTYEQALETLTTLDGVGDKVANCILLFSLDKLEAFPVDVWIQRAVRDRYINVEFKPSSRRRLRTWAQDYFGPYAGYANHYLFHDRRLVA